MEEKLQSKLKDFLDFVTPRVLDVYEQFLSQGVGEIFFVTGAEYLGPPLGSPDLFHRLVTEYDRGLFELIRRYGKKTILHCHGRLREILGELIEIGPDSMNT